MRISDDLKRCVVFIGFATGGDFRPAGTGFFIRYAGHAYLVTVQHIAIQIGDAPFVLRLNKADGTSSNYLVDPFERDAGWFCNTIDDNVDLAVMPFDDNLKAKGYDVLYMPEAQFGGSETIRKWEISVGDPCYAIGLFRLMAGKTRNLPVVHTGNIALMPQDEKVPVKDWLAPTLDTPPRYIEGYLAEMTNLNGLSGAPVFVRPTVTLYATYNQAGEREKRPMALPSGGLYLLGVWQGSWDAPPERVHDVMGPVRVPVGMGTVVPADKLLDILDMAELRAYRAKRDAAAERDLAALPDRILVPDAAPTAGENRDD